MSQRPDQLGSGARHAIIIACNHAPHADKAILQSPEKEARALARVLRKSATCDFVVHRFLGAASKSDSIRNYLDTLLPNLTSKDSLLLVWSGHGLLWDDDLVLGTVDVNSDQRTGGLTCRWLHEQILLNSSLGHAVLILNCCHAAAGVASTDLGLQLNKAFGSQGRTYQDVSTRVVIAASQTDEPAHEAQGQSALLSRVIACLRGEATSTGEVTVDSLWNYLATNMGALAQRPHMYTQSSVGKLVLAWHPKKAPIVHEDLRRILLYLIGFSLAIFCLGILLIKVGPSVVAWINEGPGTGGLHAEAARLNPPVHVMSGTLIMGRVCDAKCPPHDEMPPMEIPVSAFSIDRYEVSIEQYALCMKDGVCQPPVDQQLFARHQQDQKLPVTGLMVDQALTYCTWQQGTLPTEVEWEWVARGSVGSLYPWESKAQTHRVNLSGKPDALLWPVDSVPESATTHPQAPGVFHVLGNAAEWTISPPQEYGGSYNPTLLWNPSQGAEVIVRGGGANEREDAYVATTRGRRATKTSDPFLGFRCVYHP